MPGKNVQGIRVSGADLYQSPVLQQYERTVVLVDVTEKDSYVLDVFRVVGGSDHVKLTHGYFGELTADCLLQQPCELGFDAQISEVRCDIAPVPGWQATWNVRDDYHYLPPQADIRLHYFDATHKAMAGTAKTWIAFGFNSDQTAEIPSLLVRRQSTQPGLRSCFVDVIEPCEKTNAVKTIRRLEPLTSDQTAYSDMNMALCVSLQNGEQDWIIAMDVENPANEWPSFAKNRLATVPQWQLTTDAEFCLLRKNPAGQIKKIALAHGTFLTCGDFALHAEAGSAFLELDVRDSELAIASGDAKMVKSAVYQAKPMLIKESFSRLPMNK